MGERECKLEVEGRGRGGRYSGMDCMCVRVC
jgi:hypothetical protein